MQHLLLQAVMRLSMPSFVTAVALLAASGIAATQDTPRDVPKKPLAIVVGFEAGGAADHAACIVAKKLADNLGTPVVVDNKPGAGGTIAHESRTWGPVIAERKITAE